MALRKITGARVVDLLEDVRKSVDPPTITIYYPARAAFKALSLALLGVTAFTSVESLEAVREAAAGLDEVGDAPWTQLEARQILGAVGSLPAPTHVTVSWVDGEATALFRVVPPKTPKARALTYKKGTKRAGISLLALLRTEGTTVPRGMALEVPVKLVEDEQGLALAAYIRKGTLRSISEEERADETASPQK
jgi:hypothetical protein